MVATAREVEERLYKLNAYVSGCWLTKLRKPSYKDLEVLNRELSEIILLVRELEK